MRCRKCGTGDRSLTEARSLPTLNEMEKRLKLVQYGLRLWAREKAKQIRARVESVLEALRPGDVLIVDAAEVEAFDFSFADELFAKTLLILGAEYPGRFMIVENLSECANENLAKALENLNLTIIERKKGKLGLLGKVHPTDHETFAQVVAAEATSAATLSKRLQVNLTAMNERLSKLTSLGLVRREKASSASGREQYVYKVLS